ncbi:hypothetical protein BO94DRAFT_1199 [Aspergillus sclerotioniger CBS 115572]|uniref:Uncharacterized protein n=1 Tax=Aspergillus sclerotioniger CBS 115572 TaxID=1450535 RepID=A0A317XGR1_9EURO|nr:hypothetical protein BO94DRAFT_1199 [Aspergillus sclerotioniger CBS 115572]PWY96160.1 hypothetical protein BO94DRAFT_1199 [Aspergillus sclerotioniger CBS 115572]
MLQYLFISLPAIPVNGAAPSYNTTNPRYDADDIETVSRHKFCLLISSAVGQQLGSYMGN